jgi:hypothetical protein
MRKTRQNRTTFCAALFAGIVLLAVSAFVAAADNGPRIPVVSVRKDANGITLKMNPGVLKLQVFSSDMIRVWYAPGDTLPASKSLAVIGKPTQAAWRMVETSTEVRLTTAEVEAQVNRRSGAISFFDRMESRSWLNRRRAANCSPRIELVIWTLCEASKRSFCRRMRRSTGCGPTSAGLHELSRIECEIAAGES